MWIETPRLVLRRWSAADVDALARVDAAAWRSRVSHEDTVRRVERYEAHWAAHGFGRFAVADRATGELVGRVGVMREPEWAATAEQDEIGWTLAPARWGEGLATEAAVAAIADTFDRVGLERIISWTTPDNLASQRVTEKCGLALRGTTHWEGSEYVWDDIRCESTSA